MNLLPRLTSILSCILSRIPKHTCTPHTPFHLRFLLRFHLFSHLSRAKSPFSLAFNFLPLASLPIYQSFDSRFSSGVHTHTQTPFIPVFSFGTQTNAFARFAITHRLFTLESISLSLSLPSFLSSHFPFVLSFSSLRSHLFFFSFCRVSQERIYMCLKIVNN